MHGWKKYAVIAAVAAVVIVAYNKSPKLRGLLGGPAA